VTYLAAALFFSLAFLAAATALHLLVRAHWNEILLALRGELGTVKSKAAWSAPAVASPPRHAAS
jgi:hypothetical protein